MIVIDKSTPAFVRYARIEGNSMAWGVTVIVDGKLEQWNDKRITFQAEKRHDFIALCKNLQGAYINEIEVNKEEAYFRMSFFDRQSGTAMWFIFDLPEKNDDE